jgi:hypothetical protein
VGDIRSWFSPTQSSASPRVGPLAFAAVAALVARVTARLRATRRFARAGGRVSISARVRGSCDPNRLQRELMKLERENKISRELGKGQSVWGCVRLIRSEKSLPTRQAGLLCGRALYYEALVKEREYGGQFQQILRYK